MKFQINRNFSFPENIEIKEEFIFGRNLISLLASLRSAFLKFDILTLK